MKGEILPGTREWYKLKFHESESVLAEAQRQLELIQSQRKAAMETEKADASKALHALAGAHICTPVEGYGSNSSWAISDLCRAVKELQSERDKARQWSNKWESLSAMQDKTIESTSQQLAASQERERVLREIAVDAIKKIPHSSHCPVIVNGISPCDCMVSEFKYRVDEVGK